MKNGTDNDDKINSIITNMQDYYCNRSYMKPIQRYVSSY